MGAQQDRNAAILRRLAKEHGSDADDVSEEYIRALEKLKQLSRLKVMPKVVKELKAALESGYTSDGEGECIKILENL